MTGPLIDRRHERELFAKLLAERAPRALLISDRQGQGKSRLMRELESMCRPERIPAARVDLAQPQVQSPFGFAARVASSLGRSGVDFPKFAAATAEARGGISGTVSQHGDQHGGSQRGVSIEHSTVIVTGSALLDEFTQLGCVQAFVDDLVAASQSRRLVLLVDSYEREEADDVRGWFLPLLDDLLHHRAHPPGILVVVTGIDLLPALLPAEPLRKLLGEGFDSTVHPLPELSPWEPEDVRTLFESRDRDCPDKTATYIADMMQTDIEWTVYHVSTVIVDVLAAGGARR